MEIHMHHKTSIYKTITSVPPVTVEVLFFKRIIISCKNPIRINQFFPILVSTTLVIWLTYLILWIWGHTTKKCLRKYGIWVYVEEYLSIAIWFRISSPVPEMLSKIQSDPSPGYSVFFKWSWKICNSSLSRKIFEYFHLVQNFPSFPEMLSKLQSDPFPMGYSVFFKWPWKIRNLSLCKNIGLEFPPGSRDVIENSIRPFSIGLRDFSLYGLSKYAISYRQFIVYLDRYLNITI